MSGAKTRRSDTAARGGRPCGASRRVRPCRRGSATLEFAVLLPLLLTLALLCVDFGRFAHYYVAVTNAARAAAGFGSANPSTTATLPVWRAKVRQAAVDELTQNTWFDPAKMTMPTAQIIQEGGGFWRVQVEIDYPFQTLINWPFLPNYNQPLVLKRVVVMRGTT